MSGLTWIFLGFICGVAVSVFVELFLANGDDYEVLSLADESGTSGQIWL